MRRKKSFFLFYYIGGRYYDPASAICLDAAGLESVLCNCASFGGLDRNGIGPSPMWLAIYAYTVYCSMGELEQDEVCKRPPHKRSLLEIILIGVLLIGLSIALTAICSAIMSPLIADTMALTGQLIGGISMTQAMLGVASCSALSAIVVNGITAALGAAISGGNPWQAANEAGTKGAIFAFALTVVIYSIRSVIDAANIQSQCFAEGTPILTEEGSKPIEEIESGDKVWAYDEETGEKALKEVVQVFRNKAQTKTTLSFDCEDKPIECTPEHPFYVLNADDETPMVLYEGASGNSKGKWIAAKNLLAGHKCLLSDGKTAIITEAKTEQCDEFTTYNFEVADFHTYYVGEQGILVHNACNVQELHMTRQEAVKYGKEFLGDGFTKAGDGLYRSADGLRTMHFDLTHHMYNGVPSATHINLYTAKATAIAGRFKIIGNIHIFFL